MQLSVTQVLSPSACLHQQGTEPIVVGGRVIWVDHEQLILADAFGQVSLSVAQPLAFGQTTIGDLIVAVVQRRHTSFTLLNVKHHMPCPEPDGRSEFGRRALSPRGRHLAARSRAKQAVRRYFENQHFIEVDTPSAVICPGLDAFVSSWGRLTLGQDERFLITSPEFHMKRLLSAGFSQIYQICHCFRAEEHGSWHEPEFMMLEWYRAFSDWNDTMRDTEQLMRLVAGEIGDETVQRELEAPFERVTVSQAFAEYCGVSDVFSLAQYDEASYFQLFVEDVEPKLAAHPRPIFLTHYPVSQAALARPCSDEPRAAERYELYFRGQELCNGFSELTDETVQRERFMNELDRRRTSREALYPIDEAFMSALGQGMPPASGNALGFDRMVATILDLDRLDSVLSFSYQER